MLPKQLVACHYAEQIASGAITPVRIDVAPAAVGPDPLAPTGPSESIST